MRPRPLFLVACAAALACTPAPRAAESRASLAGAPAAAAPRLVGYLASWRVRSGARIADLPAQRITHLFYAFGLIGPDLRAVLGDPCLDAGECKAGETPPTPGGNFAALRALKARHPHLRIAVSIGGWLGSARFSDAALTDASRRRFAASAVALFLGRFPGLFDGLDIDWEFPVAGGEKGNVERPEDRENFTRLLAELRRQLDSAGRRDGRHYELSIAASARPSEIANLEIARLVPLLDFIGVMTYDYHTGMRTAHFNAPLFAAAGDPTPELTTDASVRAYLAAGVPKAKLLTGVPFFGKSWGDVPPANEGLFQPGVPGPEAWRSVNASVLRERAADTRGFARHWSEGAQVPWLYDPTSRVFLSYEDSTSVARKGAYVRERALGGVIVWELWEDSGELLRVLSRELRR